MCPIIKGLIAAALMFVTATPVLAQAPSGDITFTSESVGAANESRRVEGTLHFKDKSYPFTVTGVRVAALGGKREAGAGEAFNEGTGNVFNLLRVEDFAGNFVPVKPGPALASDATTEIIENAKGVRLEIHTTAPGTRVLEWPADGVVFSLK
jgi:hypothetical protein